MTALGIRTGGLTTQSFSWLAKKHHLTEEEVRDLDRRYKVADLDRSGELDKDELRILLKNTIASKASDAGLNKFFDSQWHNVDRDGNGTVDFDEFLSLYAILKVHPGQAGVAPKAGAAAPAAAGAAAGDKGKEAAGAAGGAKSAAADTKKSTKKGLGVAGREKRQAKGASKKRVRTFKPHGSLLRQNYVSQDIVWAAVRTNNCFLVKRGGVTLAREPGNLKNKHSRYHSGLVHNRSVDIAPTEGGINLTLSRGNKKQKFPSQSHYSTTFTSADNKRVAASLSNQLKGYRQSSVPLALARMSKLRAASARGAPATRKAVAGKSKNANAAGSSSTQAAAAPTTAQ